MPRVRDLLYRFRPAGAPGAASATGVPADRSADLAAELAPLFARLADTERECAQILERAHRDVTAIRAGDAERARSTVASAAERATAERADAAARACERGAGKAADVRAAAEREAAALEMRTAERIPPMVADVVASVSGFIDAGTT